MAQPTVLDIVNVVLGTIPKIAPFEGDVSLAVTARTALYHQLQGIFGKDILPDKTPDEILGLADMDWTALQQHIAEERARLDAEAGQQVPPQTD